MNGLCSTLTVHASSLFLLSVRKDRGGDSSHTRALAPRHRARPCAIRVSCLLSDMALAGLPVRFPLIALQQLPLRLLHVRPGRETRRMSAIHFTISRTAVCPPHLLNRLCLTNGWIQLAHTVQRPLLPFPHASVTQPHGYTPLHDIVRGSLPSAFCEALML